MLLEKVEFPITGKVTSVMVQPGAKVKEGDVLCMLEAMKMENPILATVSGTVKEINCSAGQVVEVGSVAAVIEH